MTVRNAFLLFFLVVAIERIISTFVRKEPAGEIMYKWLTIMLISTYTIGSFIGPIQFYINGIEPKMVFSVAGFIMFFLAIALRKSAMKMLGPNWSVQTRLIAGQRLIKTGPYKYLKHPYYAAVMLEMTGVALIFNSIAAVIFTYLIHLPFLLIRIHLEEKLLISQFGEEYSKY